MVCGKEALGFCVIECFMLKPHQGVPISKQGHLMPIQLFG